MYKEEIPRLLEKKKRREAKKYLSKKKKVEEKEENFTRYRFNSNVLEEYIVYFLFEVFYVARN